MEEQQQQVYQPDNIGAFVALVNAAKNKDVCMMELAATEILSDSDKNAALWTVCLKFPRFKYHVVKILLDIIGYHHLDSKNQNGTSIVELAHKKMTRDELLRFLSLGPDLNVWLESGQGFIHLATTQKCIEPKRKKNEIFDFENLTGRFKDKINFNLQTGPGCVDVPFWHKFSRTEYAVEQGETPLHQACKWGSLTVVRMLCQKKVNPNLQECEGRTPLHCLILGDHEEPFSFKSSTKEREHILRFLCSRYPETNTKLKDHKGRTVFDLIRLRMYQGDFVPVSFYQTKTLDPRRDPGATKNKNGFIDCLVDRLFKVQQATMVANECAKVLPRDVMELIGTFASKEQVIV